VRRKKVLEALESQWLKLNHHDYADLEISYENLNDYPEDVPPAVVDYHHRETNKFLESTSVHNMEAKDGTADGMCPLTVHGITGEQYANASTERLKTIAMEHLTDMGKFIAFGHRLNQRQYGKILDFILRCFLGSFPMGLAVLRSMIQRPDV